MPRKHGRAPAVGHIECLSCGELAVIRKKTNDQLYYVCRQCGRGEFTYARGQETILTKGILWSRDEAGELVPPDDVPKWIRNNLATTPDYDSGDRYVPPAQRPAAGGMEPEPKETEPDRAPEKKKKGILSGGLFS